MLDPKDIGSVIKDVLHRLGENEPSVIRLIKGTFLFESGLESLGDKSNPHNPLYGLGMLSEKRINQLVSEYIRFRPLWRSKIHSAIGISVDTYPIERLIRDMDSNIALMVAMTYYWYMVKFDAPPADDLRSIARCYQAHYYDAEYYPDLVSNFVSYYEEVFTK